MLLRTLLTGLPLRVVALWPTTQELHSALHVDDNFGGVPFDTVFFPLSCLKLTFDVYLRSFPQILTSDFSDFPKQRNTVPFGLFDFLSRLLVSPLLTCCKAEIGYCITVR